MLLSIERFKVEMLNVFDMVDCSLIILGLPPFIGAGFVSYNMELSYWPGPGCADTRLSELNRSPQVPKGTEP